MMVSNANFTEDEYCSFIMQRVAYSDRAATYTFFQQICPAFLNWKHGAKISISTLERNN